MIKTPCLGNLEFYSYPVASLMPILIIAYSLQFLDSMFRTTRAAGYELIH